MTLCSETSSILRVEGHRRTASAEVIGHPWAALRRRWRNWLHLRLRVGVVREADLIGLVGRNRLAGLAEGRRRAGVAVVAGLCVAHRDLACVRRGFVAIHLVFAVDLDRLAERADLDHHDTVAAEAHEADGLRNLAIDPLLELGGVGIAVLM